jgi:hypothetical protein
METKELVKQEQNGKVALRLPTIAELMKDVEGIEKTEGLNALLSNAPPEKWVKEHPFIRGYWYLPIDKVEYLLRKIFKVYEIEVRKTGMLMNAVEVTVRVHYLDPATKQMRYHDGVGAQELQTEAKTGPLKMDMSNVNKGAVTMALPIAKSLAVKDACDHFGKLFGCDLNRKDTLQFEPDKEILGVITLEELQALYKLKEPGLSKTEIESAKRIIEQNEVASFKKLQTLLIAK